jgi:hypothetical protein
MTFQPFTYPLPEDVSTGEPIEASWGNSVRSKLDNLTPICVLEGGVQKHGGLQILTGSGLVSTDGNGAFYYPTSPWFINKGVAYCGLYMSSGWYVDVYTQDAQHFEAIVFSCNDGSPVRNAANIAVQVIVVGHYK